VSKKPKQSEEPIVPPTVAQTAYRIHAAECGTCAELWASRNCSMASSGEADKAHSTFTWIL
jgi:hypothetical protein